MSFRIPRCGAIGSALALGACDRLPVRPRMKPPKTLVNADFSAHSEQQKSPFKRGLTTDLTTYGKTSKIQYFSHFGVWRSWSRATFGSRTPSLPPIKSKNAEKPWKHWLFRHSTLSQNPHNKWFDHRFDHLRKNLKNSIFFTLRGVAQLVARDVWEQDTAPKASRSKKRRKPL